MSRRLILASASRSRAQVLSNAGVDFDIVPSQCDEAEIKSRMASDGATVSQVALALANAKAREVAERFGDALVIGADQMMVCDGEWYDKPADLVAARRHLMALRGRTHHLVSGTVVLCGPDILWSHEGTIDMTMREFSETFLDDYIAAVGDDLLRSVGAYQLEGRGSQLFSEIGGDFFSILGLPLLPLLTFLREQGQVRP